MHTETLLTSQQKNLKYTFISWSKQKGITPLHIDRAEGSYLYTADGRRILDFSSQLVNANIGHGRQEVTQAVVQQMQKLSFVSCGMTTDVRGELGERLAAITPPGLNKTLFTLGGSESIENAIKLARIYTGRHKIIAQYRSYHGATMGAITAGGDPRRAAVDSQAMPGVVHVENPYFYRCPWYSSSPEECGERALRNLEQVLLYQGPSSVAAILMEGESGTSGCIKYPPFYLRGVRELCDRYGILFICDEVMSGFGRTGKWFGVDHHAVSPDLMCIAKGLTCGYIPLGGVVVHDRIASAFDDTVLPLGLTYSAHAVACAAALAVLDIYRKENLVQRAADTGRYIDQCMEQLKTLHPSIGDWRNTGMLGCLELVKNRQTKEPMAPWNCKPQDMGAMAKFAARLKELDLYTMVRWSYVFVAPPLTASRQEVDEGLDKISQALRLTDAEVRE